MEPKIIAHPGMSIINKGDRFIISVDRDLPFNKMQVTPMWLPILFQFDREKYDLRVYFVEDLRKSLVLSKFNIKGCPRIQVTNLTEKDVVVKAGQEVFEVHFFERITTKDIKVDFKNNFKPYWIDEE